MKVERFVTGVISTNCYLALNEETKEVVIVGPAAAPKYLLEHMESEGMKPQAILLTHAHLNLSNGSGRCRSMWRSRTWTF